MLVTSLGTSFDCLIVFRLSLGRVNEFGIFEPIFEPEPDSGNGTSTGMSMNSLLVRSQEIIISPNSGIWLSGTLREIRKS